MKIGDTPSLFKIAPLILPTPRFLWKKSEPPSVQKFQTLNTTSLYKEGGRGGGGGRCSKYVQPPLPSP